ncbi:MAG: SusC/RagA family TonB-linked outer membrane protein [Odoribacter sp.]
MKKNWKLPHSVGWRWQQKLKIMKLCLLLTWISVMNVTAATYSQNVKLDIELKNVSMERVLNTIRSQSEFSFFYDDHSVEQISNLSLTMKEASVNEVLDFCLKNSGFGYRIVDKTIILYRKNNALPQQQQIVQLRGKVTDVKGIVMPGVTVRLDGTTVGTATDVNGEFMLPLPEAKGVLVFSFIGFKLKKVTINGTKPIDVRLEEETAKLDEVTVTAYGSKKKREVISAISSIKAEDFKELPSPSLENLLQGRMAGVEINNMSGSPGGGGSVVAIRGYNSLFVKGEGSSREYAEPLYVVDGVPVHSFSSPVTGANTLSDIDPSMIESIEVLKDAASAAIYGSRAGNGVILITTKKGRSGKATFTANASYSASWLPKTVQQTGGREERLHHLTGLRNYAAPYTDPLTGKYVIPGSYDDAYSPGGNRGQYDYFWNGGNGEDAVILQDSLNPFYNNSTNWFRYAFETARVWNANIQISGGNENMQYIIGSGYYNETGIMMNSGFSRANLMSNLTVTPTKRLRVDARSYFAYSDRSRGGNLSGGNSKIEGMSVDPIYESTLLPGSGEVEKDVLRGLNSMTEKNHSYTLRLSLNLNYEIMKGLSFSTSGSLDFNQQNQNHFEPSTISTEKRSKSEGVIAKDIMLLNENLLNYNLTLGEKHNFDVMLGLSFQKDQSFSNKGSGEGGPNDKIQYVGNGWGGNSGLIDIGAGNVKSAFSYQSEFTEERLESYFGRFSYNYDKKYLFEATVRRDGSSVFGENVRWATFPSVSAGWAFSEEKFMKSCYWLSFGKIRASWGTSGQKFGQRYLAHGLMEVGGDSFLGQTGMVPSGGMINRDLTWEETDQYDVGLDVDFFDYRWKLKVDWYRRYTKSQLHEVNLPGNMFFHGSQWQNAVETSNQGLEVETEIDILRETAVKWRMKINVARNWNKLEKSYNGMDIGQYVIGKPLYQIKVYDDHGFYNSMDEVPIYYDTQGNPYPLHEGVTYSAERIFVPGSRKITDLNSDGAITPEDQYYAASPLPLANGGIVSELRWKNFDLNILFNYSIGRNIYKIYDDMKMAPSPSSSPIFGIKDATYWPQPGAEYPRLQMFGVGTPYNGVYRSSLEKVHHLRLKQLTLGYNLEDQIVNKMGLKGVRAFMTIENLFILTNYSGLDPEIVSIYDGCDNLRNYPLPRKFTVGLTINF